MKGQYCHIEEWEVRATLPPQRLQLRFPLIKVSLCVCVCVCVCVCACVMSAGCLCVSEDERWRRASWNLNVTHSDGRLISVTETNSCTHTNQTALACLASQHLNVCRGKSNQILKASCQKTTQQPQTSWTLSCSHFHFSTFTQQQMYCSAKSLQQKQTDASLLRNDCKDLCLRAAWSGTA